MAIALKSQGHRVRIVLMKNQIEPKFLSVLSDHKISIEVLNINVLRNLIFKKDFVNHTTGFLPDLLLWLFAKKRWVSTVRNSPFEDYVKKFLFGKLLASMHLFILKQCRHVVGCSFFISKTLSKYRIKSSTINNSGPDFGKNQCLKITNPPSFLMLGSLNERKNPEYILEVFSQNKNFGVIHIAGSGPLEESLKNKFKEFKNINFLGQVSDPLSNMDRFDILVSSSKSEGMPNSCLEALAFGMPCVLSQIPPHKYLESFHPESVRIFDNNSNITEISSFFEKVHNDFIMGLFRNEKGLHEEFSIKTMVTRYLNIYKRLIV